MNGTMAVKKAAWTKSQKLVKKARKRVFCGDSDGMLLPRTILTHFIGSLAPQKLVSFGTCHRSGIAKVKHLKFCFPCQLVRSPVLVNSWVLVHCSGEGKH